MNMVISYCEAPDAYGERERQVVMLAHGLGATLYAHPELIPYAQKRNISARPCNRLTVLWGILRERFSARARVYIVGSAQRTGTLWARMLGMRVIWIAWSSADLIHHRVFTRIWLRLLARGVHIVTCSREGARRLIAYGYRERQITMIPLAFEISDLQQQASVFDEMAEQNYRHGLSLCYVIGIISPLVPGSGIEHAIAAIRDLRELIPHAQLIIVGDGPEKRRLQWLASMLSVQHIVRFVGMPDHVQRWYQFFNLTLLPTSAHERIGLNAIESLAAGIPVCAGLGEGLSEITDELDRLQLATVTSATLVDLIIDAERNQAVIASLTKTCRERIIREHESEVIMSQWRNMLTRSIN